MAPAVKKEMGCIAQAKKAADKGQAVAKAKQPAEAVVLASSSTSGSTSSTSVKVQSNTFTHKMKRAPEHIKDFYEKNLKFLKASKVPQQLRKDSKVSDKCLTNV